MPGEPSLPPDDPHGPPPGTPELDIEAAGKLSEALEWVERARGRLYDLHQMIGRADFLLDDAADLLDRSGHDDLAALLRDHLVGRNVLEGRWTFQVVEEFDDGYYAAFRDTERHLRERLTGGRRHVYEALMKERRRTHGARHHEARPGDPPGQEPSSGR